VDSVLAYGCGRGWMVSSLKRRTIHRQAARVTVFDLDKRRVSVWEDYHETEHRARLTDAEIDAVLNQWAQEWLEAGGMKTVEIITR
jgi:hypothetical protein